LHQKNLSIKASDYIGQPSQWRLA